MNGNIIIMAIMLGGFSFLAGMYESDNKNKSKFNLYSIIAFLSLIGIIITIP